MKIHIVLRKGSSEEAVAEVIRTGGMTGVNAARTNKFGIVSGEADASSLQALRALAQVESVELDEVKHTLSR